MSRGGAPADYVDVAERIRQFQARYPDGSLATASKPQLFEVGERTYIAYHARASRTPDDTRPGEGWAWEPVPGPTPFTRDSELQNAETAAWGRAIVALGFATKHVASSDEIRNRTGPPATDETERQEVEHAWNVAQAAQEAQTALRRSAHQAAQQELSELLGALAATAAPVPDGYTTWIEYAAQKAYEQFGAHSSADMNAEEIRELIAELDREAGPQT